MKFTLNYAMDDIMLVKTPRSFEDWQKIAMEFNNNAMKVMDMGSADDLGPYYIFLFAHCCAGDRVQDYFTLLMFSKPDDENPLQDGMKRFQQYEGDFGKFDQDNNMLNSFMVEFFSSIDDSSKTNENN